MIELLRGLAEWGREAGVSPLVFAWLAGGWMVLRLLAMVGAAASKTAATMWTRYTDLLTKLEDQLTQTRHELALVRAERNDLERELEEALANYELMKDKLRRERLRLHRGREDEE